MPYAIDEPDFEVYHSAEPRVGGLGFHPSHRWVYFDQGDCLDGLHASIRCSRCDINPLPRYCYFELGYRPEATAEMLAAEDATVAWGAFEPCPEELED